jgi:hypothetical protein
MPETSQMIRDWGDRAFGEVQDLRVLLTRARQEIEELEEAIIRQDRVGAGEEAADVAILLHRLVGILGLELSEAVDAKMAVNRARRWHVAGDGTGAHV